MDYTWPMNLPLMLRSTHEAILADEWQKHSEKLHELANKRNEDKKILDNAIAAVMAERDQLLKESKRWEVKARTRAAKVKALAASIEEMVQAGGKKPAAGDAPPEPLTLPMIQQSRTARIRAVASQAAHDGKLKSKAEAK